MGDRFLEAGKIINTHGVRGEIKILPWADDPGFLTRFKRLYIDGSPLSILSSKIYKGCIIAALEGVDDLAGAAKLRNKTVFIDRDDASLEEGRYFVADLIGMRAVEAGSNAELGTVADILALPSNDVYVIQGAREILVPAVPEFVVEKNLDAGYIVFRLIEGM